MLLALDSCSNKQRTSVHYRETSIDDQFYEMKYENGNWKHPDYKGPFESFGNHRIVLEVVDHSQGYVQAIIPWRRNDCSPEKKDVVIVDAKTVLPVEFKRILGISNESGHVLFKANKGSSLYYAYYLPYSSSGGYYPKVQYKKPEASDDLASIEIDVADADQIKKIPLAKIKSAQSIDEFHSFFPMEIIATKTEVETYTQRHTTPFYLFPEYRNHPIKMYDYLPKRWIKDENLINGIEDDVYKGEYYTFQVGLFSSNNDLKDVEINFSDLAGKSGMISKENISCFNISGIDLNGIPFEKAISVNKNNIQPLWFGIEIPKTIKKGSYQGLVIIQPAGYTGDTVYVNLNVLPETVSNSGDDSPENMTRLRWLNSTVGTDENLIIKPFVLIKTFEKTLHILGREVVLNGLGFPKQIYSYYTQEMTKFKDDKEEILARAIRFEIIDKDGNKEEWHHNVYEIDQGSASNVEWKTINESDKFLMHLTGALEYDGLLDYKIKLIAKKDAELNDIKLHIPMHTDAATYMLGLGRKGGAREENISWKWNITKHQEGAWFGAINKGLQYVLRDNNYERPLNTNFYQAKPLNLPPSWYNDGKGGINVRRKKGYINIDNYSGSRTVSQGDTLNFNIRFLITPFKLINTKDHFTTRFVHAYLPIDSVIKQKGTIVNVHHANEINPYVNYPFYNTNRQKEYIDEAHEKGIKVKIYNTIRELSYRAYELFALKSLGNEILNDGEGGGHSWLQEHMKSNYHSAWHATEVNDASVLNKGSSRWTNYYIEGINWSAKNQKIDGLYLDDIAFSRTTIKRIANVLSSNRDDWVIDLHSANQFNERDGFTNSALLYMEHFPFISRLWFGEYFEYDLKPDYWLTEVSGIPFGLTGEMLEKGGHPFRGMVYGMTNRVFGQYSPKALWELFDEFDISDSKMLGYWVDHSPIKTDTDNIRSTIYIHPDKVLIAIGSWSSINETVPLNISWESLDFNPNKASLISPRIEGLQDFNTYNPSKPISVERNQGLLLILKKE